jgi:signal transduction histidine kinase/ligand-binding sensor domain-containing protein
MNRFIARSILGVLSVFICVAAGIDTRDRTIFQFQHDSWTAKDGVPAGIFSIAQTTDGYMWLGTISGLYRFDGVQFEHYDLSPWEQEAPDNAQLLRASSDGGLWFNVGHRVCFLKDDRPTCYEPLPGFTSIAPDPNGTVWVGSLNGLFRLVGSRYEQVPEDWGYPAGKWARNLLVDRQGNLWVTAQDSIMFLPRGQKHFEKTGERISPRVFDMVEAPDGAIWLSDGGHLRRIRTRIGKSSFPPIEIDLEVVGLVFDHVGSLWMTSVNGLLRVPFPERVKEKTRVSDNPNVERFYQADGLTSTYAWKVFEDRESNIWVSTSAGLDRFRATDLVPVKLPSGFNTVSFAAGEEGAGWTGFFFSREWTEIHMPGRAPFRHHFGANFGWAYRDRSGVLWVGTDGQNAGLWRVAHGPLVRVPLPDGVPARSRIQSITKDHAGGLWIGVSGSGAFRLSNGVWTKAPENSEYMRPLITDSLGRVWFQSLDNPLGFLDGKQLRRFSLQDGVPASVYVMYERNGHIWVAGRGLALLDGNRFRALNADGMAFDGISGMVETANGDLWLNALLGLIHVPASEVRHAIEKPDYRVRCEVLGLLDGFRTGTVPLVGPSTAVETSDGRLWFINGYDQLFYLDPARRSKSPMAPPVFIRSLNAAGKAYKPPEKISLPGGTRNLRVAYTALNYALPQRVQFRYELEGVDKGWQEAGTRREAFYTNLGPGNYRFRVIAGSSDGVWNEVGAALSFSIAPAYYQAWWFLALCGVSILAAALAAYRLRVRQITVAMNARFDERLAERTRIARDFHDTLLQTIQGSKMVADDALDKPADSGQLRGALERLSGWLEQAMQEGRSALSSLRSSTTEGNDLAEAMRRAIEECRFHSSIEFDLSVDGASQEMHPIVRDEVYRIGYEAIRNACIHSEGTALRVELSYLEDLILRVIDNGKGMDPKMADRSKVGHFGLIGMYERASRISGKLSLSSSPGVGTEVQLVVPRKIAFPNERPLGRFAAFRRFF